jgi:RND superfamily putative drug exporter
MSARTAARSVVGMTTITRIALAHRRLVALAWVALAVVGGVTASSTTSRLTHTFATPGSPGYETNQRIIKSFGIDGNEQPTIAVLHLPAGQNMHTPAGQTAAARTFAAAHNAGHLAVADYANTHNPVLVSADGRTTWALINMPNPDVPLGSGVMQRIPHALNAAAPSGSTVAVTGFEQIQGSGGGKGPSTLVETLIGMVGALIILALVFGSALAIVPLLMAIPSILISMLLVGGVTHLTSVSFIVEFLVALIGLGVAIDYSLLVVTRWREEREQGHTNEEAIAIAGQTAGHAVVLSGLTVTIGLLSLVVLPVPFLRSIGYAGIMIPLVAIAAAITLLPVTLAAWGPALDRIRFRRASSTTFSRGWAWWGQFVVRRRWIAGAAGLVIVLGLAVPALSMNTGQPSSNAFSATTPAGKTLHGLEQSGVPSAVVFPVQLLVHGGAAPAARATKIARDTPGVYTVFAPKTPSFQRGQDSLISVIPRTEGSTSSGRALVDRLRSRLAPVQGVEVGGNTAQNKDFVHAVYGNFPLMLGLIALVTFLLLARAFRSIVLAAKAVVLNVISLGASYGFLVLFWQQGHGSHLVYGVPATGSIRDFIPIVVFAFLFGLSMDYEVFVLARMREEYDATGSTPKAIVNALSRTGRLVTSAAMILAVSFLSLSTNPDLPVRTIATGLAFGILLDSIVIRTLLVPALVALMGRWNWWMPEPLGRLLRVEAPPAPVTE